MDGAGLEVRGVVRQEGLEALGVAGKVRDGHLDARRVVVFGVGRAVLARRPGLRPSLAPPVVRRAAVAGRQARRDVDRGCYQRERRERRPEAPRGRLTRLMAAPPAQFA